MMEYRGQFLYRQSISPFRRIHISLVENKMRTSEVGALFGAPKRKV